MIQAIFWDNDGVLVDTEALFFAANREVMAEQGFELDSEMFADWSLRRGQSVFDMLPGSDQKEREALRVERNRRYGTALRQGVRVFDGVEACLAGLHGRLPMGVVTSAYPEHFEIIHAQTNLLQYFDFVLKGGDYDRHKPHPDPYLEAAARIGAEPQACLVVEDSERGLRAAISAGMKCIMIPNPLAKDADLDGAHAVVEAVHEVPAIVANLLEQST